jgi:hypothetical protein
LGEALITKLQTFLNFPEVVWLSRPAEKEYDRYNYHHGEDKEHDSRTRPTNATPTSIGFG